MRANEGGPPDRLRSDSGPPRNHRPWPGAHAGSAAEWAYATVKERLLDGDDRAGQRLSVDRLRAEFDVSKQPIMEALRLLHAEKLVTIVPQAGC
jgi:DNA-binding GntR family transcriptional regulator